MAEPEAPGSAALDVKAARKRVLRSLKHHKEAMDRFLPAFLQALAPVDQAQSRALLKRLSTMAQEGEAPSFAGCPALPPPASHPASPPVLPVPCFCRRACGPLCAQIRERGRGTSGGAWSIGLPK